MIRGDVCCHLVVHFSFLHLLFRPDKLLFHIGNSSRKTGSAKGEFSFPRGLTATQSGQIMIADTENHRIQVFNKFGVLVKVFGTFGTENGEFNQPTGISLLLYRPVHNTLVFTFSLGCSIVENYT